MRAAIYARVSTEKQAEKYGLEAQVTALRKRAKERGYAPVLDGDRDAFLDDGYSGGDLNRPALSRLRQVLRDSRADVVLCYDPDRLSRNLSDLLLLANEVEGCGARLEFITQEMDSSPEGKMFFAIRGGSGRIREGQDQGADGQGKDAEGPSGQADKPP